MKHFTIGNGFTHVQPTSSIPTHGQVYTSYVMINRGSRRNDDNYSKTTGFCQTLPQDLNEADVYFDWSYKLLSCINTLVQPTIGGQIEILGSLQEVIQLSPTDNLWAIKSCGHRIKD